MGAESPVRMDGPHPPAGLSPQEAEALREGVQGGHLWGPPGAGRPRDRGPVLLCPAGTALSGTGTGRHRASRMGTACRGFY